jgi:hypothetical protein
MQRGGRKWGGGGRETLPDTLKENSILLNSIGEEGKAGSSGVASVVTCRGSIWVLRGRVVNRGDRSVEAGVVPEIGRVGSVKVHLVRMMQGNGHWDI